MSVAYFIVPEREIDGFDHFVNGKALAQANEKTLEQLCKQLGVMSLTDFLSQDSDEIAAFLEDEGLDTPEELPTEQWFEPREGLRTVRALLQHLAVEPKAIKNAKAIVEDLREYEAVLSRLEKEEILWHLALDT
jgi:hypothetical protein